MHLWVGRICGKLAAGARALILESRSSPQVDSGYRVTKRDTIRGRLKELNGSGGLSWRKIAALPDFVPVPAGTLCRYAKTGYLPPKWRVRFGLIAYVPTLACPVHGVVHCYDCETQIVKPARNHPARPRPPRISIRLDDPDSAARSILSHMEAGAVVKLIDLLERK